MDLNKERDILKEAIADAQKLRETAYENARVAVEEAFRPRLQSLISTKIKEDAAAENDQEEIEDITTAEEPIEEPTDDTLEEPVEESPIEAIEESPIEAVENAIEQAGEAIESAKEAIETIEDETGEDEDIDFSIEDDETSEEEDEEIPSLDFNLEDDENEEDAMNIEAIIKELEGEEDQVNEEYQSLIDEIEDGKNIDIEIEDDEDTMDEEIDITIDDDEDQEENTQLQENFSQLQKDFETLQEQHQQAMKVVQYMKNKLNEVNLVNAKLLYSNKLFKTYSLDNFSKMKVIESLDRAKNSREAKLIYVTLAESITTGAVKKQNKKIVENVIKGLTASEKTAPTTPSKKIINETFNSQKTRFQTLAGILKG